MIRKYFNWVDSSISNGEVLYQYSYGYEVRYCSFIKESSNLHLMINYGWKMFI